MLHDANLFVCRPCHRNVERWESDTLIDKEKNDKLTEYEESRLVVLRARAAKKREQSRGLRQKAVKAQGLYVVQERERNWDRARRARRTADPNKHKADLKSSAASEAKRLARGGQRKAKGETRKIERERLYPDYFMKLLDHALRLFFTTLRPRHGVLEYRCCAV